ncbi:MAG: hypothetical protein KIS73_27005 [Enhydrobacter sp.]|nr:hypothetical protein [Enhydrobacter sp.]
MLPGIGHISGSFPAPYLARPTATPQDILGATLVGLVDFEDNDQITESSGAISAYADPVNGASYAQASGVAQPVLAANAVTGRQVARFAGAQHLEIGSIPTGIPTAANPGEVIVICTQAAEYPADTTTKTVVAWGGTAATGNRRVLRATNAGGNGLQFGVGNGSSSILDVHPALDFFGNRLARGVVSGSAIYADLDGAISAGTACVPNTGTTRLRIGANTAASAGSFFVGDISALLFTNAVLSAVEFDALAVWAGSRIFG